MSLPGHEPGFPGSLRAALTALLLVAVLSSSRAEACRGPFRPLEENVRQASAIFVGTIVEIRKVGQSELVIVFTVEETLKGTLGKTAELHSDSTTCGFGARREAGERFLMFAYGPSLGTSALSGNRMVLPSETVAQATAAVRAELKARALLKP